MTLFIRPAEIADVYALAKVLRVSDRQEILSLGITAEHALRASFRNAIIRNTAFVDGRIAAMWGLGGTMLSDIGYPWMLTAPIIETIPVSFVKEARKGIVEMLSIKSRLQGFVDADYPRACRFLERLGFELAPPAPYGPNGASFRMFTWCR